MAVAPARRCAAWCIMAPSTMVRCTYHPALPACCNSTRCFMQPHAASALHARQTLLGCMPCRRLTEQHMHAVGQHSGGSPRLAATIALPDTHWVPTPSTCPVALCQCARLCHHLGERVGRVSSGQERQQLFWHQGLGAVWLLQQLPQVLHRSSRHERPGSFSITHATRARWPGFRAPWTFCGRSPKQGIVRANPESITCAGQNHQ